MATKLGSDKKRASLKERVNDHERELAENLGGVRQPNSGATAGRKGDVLLESFLLDSKETASATLNVHSADLIKITREAEEISRIPGLVLTVGGVPATVSREWVAVPLAVFAQMLQNGQDAGILSGVFDEPTRSSEGVAGEAESGDSTGETGPAPSLER